MNPKMRAKLAELREQLQAERAKRVELRRERDAARDAFGEADFSAAGDVKITETKAFRDAEQAVANLGACEDTIAQLEQAENAMLRLMSSDEPASGHGLGNGYQPKSDGVSYGWNGQRLLAESEVYDSAKNAHLFHSRQHFGVLELGQVASREEFHRFLAVNYPTSAAGDVGTPAAPAVPPDYRGIIPPQLRRLTLLDLIPTGTTDSNIVNFVQITSIPGYAAETAELAVKPAEGLGLSDQTAPVQTIAGYVKMARQAMDDMAGLATLINTLLPYDVRRRLEGQMLSGSGTGVNLKGILNTTGIGAPASVTGDQVADGILRAMTTVILSDADPQFVTLNPLSWQSIMIQKASGSGEYMFEQAGYGPLATIAPTIWGMSVTLNRIIPQASPLVGDPMGATLLIREGVNIRASDADQDDFIRNRVTLLCETRAAFPIWRPTAFAVAPLG